MGPNDGGESEADPKDSGAPGTGDDDTNTVGIGIGNNPPRGDSDPGDAGKEEAGAPSVCDGGVAHGESCAQSPSEDAACGADCDAGTSCGSTQLICDGQCVDPQTNPSYCGAKGSCTGGLAGEVCGDLLCVEGTCRECEDTYAECVDGSYMVCDRGKVLPLDCPTGCNDSGCNPLLGLGEQCQESAECDSGACVDGTCCREECGICEACGASFNCEVVTLGEDPDTCAGENSCDFEGICRVRVASVAMGWEAGCVVLTDGGVRCWGDNLSGELGAPGARIDWDQSANSPTVRFTGATIEQVAKSKSHTCALLDDETIRCWGSGFGGVFGSGIVDSVGDDPQETPDTFPVVSFGSAIREMAVGSNLSCALLENGEVRCWGSALPGDGEPIGDDPQETPNTFPNLVSSGVANGIFLENAVNSLIPHYCVTYQGGAVHCWGGNDRGKLGSGTNTFLISDPVVNQFPANLASVATSGTGTCALVGANTLRCWGKAGLFSTSEWIGDEPDETTETYPSLVFSSPVKKAVGGLEFYCVLMEEGAVRCFGANAFGALGSGVDEYVGDEVTETPSTFPLVQFGEPIVDLAANASWGTCAVTQSGELRCWGGGFGPRDENNLFTNIGDDESASAYAPVIPIRPLAP